MGWGRDWKQKSLLMILAAALLAGEVGCGATNERKQNTEEKIQITIGFWDVEKDLAGDAVLEEIENRFNVEFVPMQMGWDDYYQKLDRWAVNNTLPDLFAGDCRNSLEYFDWIDRGLLHVIPDNLSEYPYLEAYMEGIDKNQAALVGGEWYCIPRQTYPSQAWTCIDRVVAYRWDLAQKAGITKEPENWEEFQQMILAIIRADPEGRGIQGMSAEKGDLISGWILPYASSIAVSDGNQFFWKKDADGVYRPVYMIDDLLPAFRIGREMYESGVIEKEIMLQTAGSAKEKFLRGENAAILHSGGFGNVYGNMGEYWEEYHGSQFLEDVKVLNLMPDINGNRAYPVWGYYWSESYVSARVSDEKLDRILKIYDWLLSDEGARFGSYGPEGDLYDLVDGRVVLHDKDSYVTDKYPSCKVFSMLVRWHPSTYDENFPAMIPKDYIYVNQELVRQAEQMPVPAYEPRCSSIMREEGIQFTLTVGDDFLRIMTGTQPVEEMWEEIKKEYEEKGLNDVIEIVNHAM